MTRRRQIMRRAFTMLTLILTLAAVAGPAWARGLKRSGPGLWIVTDRIVGFVPFTVYVYGKVVGMEPGQIELCRSDVALVTEAAPARLGTARPQGFEDRRDDPDRSPACTAGEVTRTPDGYDYARDMRFDRPGTYHVRLTMVDTHGNRVTSNTVQVNAF
jgi:hypothetical protein